MVLAAKDQQSPDCTAALSTLCGTYWYPLYAFARRKGMSAELAQDRTQGFFARLLEKHSLQHVNPDRGRFRSFLLVAFKNYLEDERIRDSAKKRGGGAVPISIDVDQAEQRYSIEPVEDTTPEKIFERRWALTLLERALERLGAEYESAGRARLFEHLRAHLPGESGAIPYSEAAKELGMAEVSIRVAAHRMRKRFRDLLVEEISQTLTDNEDLDHEIQHLFSAVE
ncbi:MAG: sigma-70 family RNA polymerase sigma factor [bacterium]|nr:sigma-70 family RNA polymerase sigma factor [bacterium]